MSSSSPAGLKASLEAKQWAKKRADAFCKAYKGEEYKVVKNSQVRNGRGDLLELGRCHIPMKQAVWEFLLGQTVTKRIARDIG